MSKSPIRWSPSTGHFYRTDIHGANMPADVVCVTARRHEELLTAQGLGRAIVADQNGKPALAPERQPSRDSLLSAAFYAIKEEARARILAVATLERQVNDAAAIAMDTQDAPAARDRRAKVDEIRAASNDAEALADAMSDAALAKFNAADNALWPAWSAK
jgi:hypothetical protein